MKPEYAIKYEIEGRLTTFGENVDRVVVIDEEKARYQGYPIKGTKTLKRKFENLLIITRPRERLKIVYR